MNQEILEILIGKHLDGEITPGEQRILDVEMGRDPQARELLAELKDLHEQSSELVASCIIGQGTSPGDILERAWQQASARPLRDKAGQQTERPTRRAVRRVGYVRVAVAVAAGFLLGLAVQFFISGGSAPQDDPSESGMFVQNTAGPMELEVPSLPEFPADPAGNPIRKVDWYNFIDKQGNQWLIEGLRESTVRPAAYNADL